MKFLVVLILSVSAVNCAKILGFFHFPSISHQFVFRSIAKELSLRGHEVTFVTTDPIKDSKLKNLTEVDVSIAYKVFEEIDLTNLNPERGLFPFLMVLNEYMEKVTEMEMDVEGVKAIMRKPANSYDLILMEAFNPIFAGLQHKFKAPLIAVSSFALNTFHQQFFGNPTHPILYPDFFLGYRYPLVTLREKLESLYAMFQVYIINEIYMIPRNDKLARSYFGEDMPYLKDLVKNTSLIFANVNPIFSERRPMVPNTIEVWNIHMKHRSENLSEEFQNILDNAKNGAVYFSLGTNVRFDHVKGDIKKTILDALGELPYTVLCKWETENVTGSPKNVVLKKWFPQQPILAHPNIRAFVTQGGLQSSEEAITNGVPLVVIPFLGDQPMNAKILTSHGMAETIAPKDLNKDLLRDTILKVAKDDKYRLKAQELRSIFLDQPQSGVEKIIWWCEYVIRHKGAKHLRSPGADISLWEYFMLDVLAVLLLAAVVSYMIVKRLVQLILRIFKGESRSVKGSDKKMKQKKN